jgi:chemotaxis protein MotB
MRTLQIAARAIVAGAALLVSSGCVSSAKYDEAVSRMTRTERELRADNQRLRSEAAVEAREREALETSFDLQAATIHDLWIKLEKSGLSAEQLQAEKVALAISLQATKLKLAAVRRAQSVAAARAELYRDLARKLKSMIDAGELQVTLRDGRMVIVLPTDVLFDSGKTNIKPPARAGLQRLAAVLKTVQGRHLQVAGHTDTVPISTPRFPSNWELAAGRALEVNRLLIEEGVAPQALSAAAYGEFDPIATNETEGGRAQNRRIEITLIPEIDEIVPIPE